MKLYWELRPMEKGCNGYNRNYPEIISCKGKKDAIKKCRELLKNSDLESVIIQVINDNEILNDFTLNDLTHGGY